MSVDLLDSLMTLAGELVLGRNQLLQALTRKDFKALTATCCPYLARELGMERTCVAPANGKRLPERREKINPDWFNRE